MAVRNCHGQHKWSAPKGHSMIKNDGEWENPFETAVREINEEIHYWDSASQMWCTLDQQLLKKYVTYLEHIFESKEGKYRRIGLFVICLENDLNFKPKHLVEINVCIFKYEKIFFIILFI